MYDPVSQVAYCAGRDQITHVWVEGKIRISQGQAVDWETSALFSRAQEWVKRIRERDQNP